MTDSSTISINSATLEQSQPNSTGISHEERQARVEHRKRADERAKRALARLNAVGAQKAAEKAAKVGQP